MSFITFRNRFNFFVKVPCLQIISQRHGEVTGTCLFILNCSTLPFKRIHGILGKKSYKSSWMVEFHTLSMSLLHSVAERKTMWHYHTHKEKAKNKISKVWMYYISVWDLLQAGRVSCLKTGVWLNLRVYVGLIINNLSNLNRKSARAQHSAYGKTLFHFCEVKQQIFSKALLSDDNSAFVLNLQYDNWNYKSVQLKQKSRLELKILISVTNYSRHIYSSHFNIGSKYQN